MGFYRFEMTHKVFLAVTRQTHKHKYTKRGDIVPQIDE